MGHPLRCPPSVWATGLAVSVLRRLLDVVDDERIHRTFGPFQFQPELLFERRNEARSGGGRPLLVVGRQFEVEVVVAD
jgi:hypothetical protein